LRWAAAGHLIKERIDDFYDVLLDLFRADEVDLLRREGPDGVIVVQALDDGAYRLIKYSLNTQPVLEFCSKPSTVFLTPAQVQTHPGQLAVGARWIRNSDFRAAWIRLRHGPMLY
jgi:hypothetical protein